MLKINANINMPISSLNVRESPEFWGLIGNQGREHNVGVTFQTGSRNKAGSRMRIKSIQYNLWPNDQNSRASE